MALLLLEPSNAMEIMTPSSYTLAPTVKLIAHLKAVGWGRRSTLWSLSKKLLEFLDDGMLSCQDFPGAVTTA
jgi:hypothetical protein